MATGHKTPDAIVKAAQAVRRHFPEVIYVFFSLDGSWRFMDEHMDAPAFWDKVEESVLEAAANAADDDKGLPCAYFIGDF